jgi:hypothetical protein
MPVQREKTGDRPEGETVRVDLQGFLPAKCSISGICSL